MYCARLLFLHENKGPAHDDWITVKPHEGSSDIFEVVYRSPDMSSDRMFLASFSDVLKYIDNTLTSMRHDVDPFENIQLLTVIHPSVLYHVSDMDDSSIRDLMMEIIRDSMRYTITSLSR
jgi:hypothetical protein